MTDARSAYDESNEVWPYFLITMLGIFLLPLTLSQLAQLLRATGKPKGVLPEHAKFRAKQIRQRQFASWQFWISVIGWIFVAYLIHLVRIQNTTAEVVDVWDPYEILHIARSASAKEIKSAYRKLSLQFHPDKVKDMVEYSKEQLDSIYVDISKAYRALTDDVTRENFKQYGHPDGPQPVTHGIALPAFLFNPAASVTFIAIYLVGFGVGVPLAVGTVWSRSKHRTRRGILQQTASQFAELLAKEQAHFITRARILDEVLSSQDITDSLGTTTATLEERHKLLDDYLHRKQPQSHESLVVATETVRLLSSLHDMAAIFKSLVLCRRVMETRRAIIQAVPFEEVQQAEVLQLRGVQLLNNNHTGDSNSNTEISDPKYASQLLKSVDEARSYLPRLHAYDTEYRVYGAERVYTNSRVHLEIKFAVIPFGDNIPEFSMDEIEKSGFDSKGSVSPEKHNISRPKLGTAVAPHFPLETQESWLVYISNDRDNKLMEKPLELTNMDLANLRLKRHQVNENEGVTIDTIVVPISSPSPPQPGIASTRVTILSSTYFGCDLNMPASMTVVAAPPPEPVDDLEDIDENEKARADAEDDSDEDEGLSDIDTSTDEEEESLEDKKNESNSDVKKQAKDVPKKA